MKGRIYKLKGKARIEIWANSWEIGMEQDRGGYCEICDKEFSSIKDLISHFIDVHDGGKRRKR